MYFYTINSPSHTVRLEMAKSLLLPQAYCWFQTHKQPKGIMSQMEHYLRNFIWKGSIKKSPWSKLVGVVYLSKKEGGLGLKNLACWNDVAFLKLIWEVLVNADFLWVKWTHESYIRRLYTKPWNPLLPWYSRTSSFCIQLLSASKLSVHENFYMENYSPKT